MIIYPNRPAIYRNWAYCCIKIRKLSDLWETYYAGKIRGMGEYGLLQSQGRRAYLHYCKEKCSRISRKIARYEKLKNQIAGKIGDPEQHLLLIEDAMALIGNVIEIKPRRSKKGTFILLTTLENSSDSFLLNGYDTYDLLLHGYGKMDQEYTGKSVSDNS